MAFDLDAAPNAPTLPTLPVASIVSALERLSDPELTEVMRAVTRL